MRIKRSKTSIPSYAKRERATIITQTPMRVTLGGGGTDVLWYSQLKGGAWISAAIDKYVFVFLNKTEDPFLIKASHGTEAIMSFNYKDILNPLIKECLEITNVKQGIEISTAADASAKSGLGGSGAFEVGLLHALYTYKRKSVSQLRLAKEAADIEMKRLQKPVGPQDQYIAALGGVRFFEMDTNGKVKSYLLKLSNNTTAELEENLLFFRTGIQHNTASILSDQKKRMERKESSDTIMRSLDTIKEIGLETKKQLLKGNVDWFGNSLNEHWQLKKQLSDSVTTPQIDEWYNEALKAGALGGKIMGAGGGGWFMFYVPAKKDAFRKRMAQIGLDERRMRFDWEGTKLLINLS